MHTTPEHTDRSLLSSRLIHAFTAGHDKKRGSPKKAAYLSDDGVVPRRRTGVSRQEAFVGVVRPPNGDVAHKHAPPLLAATPDLEKVKEGTAGGRRKAKKRGR